MTSLRRLGGTIVAAAVACVALLAVVASAAEASGAASPALTCSPSGATGIAMSGGARADVFDSLAQLLPSQPQKGGASAQVCQGRNAYESFQVEVTAGASALHLTSVTASALTGPGGATIPASDITVSREAYVTLKTMSDAELSNVLPRDSTTGACSGDCRFPDELIPAKDALFGQTRNAFPLTVPAGQDGAVWIDVFVPATQSAGSYGGSLTLTQDGATTPVPVSLQVVNATLPSTSSLHSVFFISRGNRNLSGSGNMTPDQYAEVAELGLDDRINVVPDFALDSGVISQNLTQFVKPLLAGSDPRVKLARARLTDFPLENDWLPSYYSQYDSWFSAAGLTARAWVYCDEGTATDCANAIATVHSQWPGLRGLAVDNASPDAAGNGWSDPNTTCTGAGASEVCNPVPSVLASTITGVAPLVQTLAPNGGLFWPGWTPGSRMPAFTNWRAQTTGREVWAYTDCYSGGCNTGDPDSDYTPDPSYDGWPSYGIDQVATEQRAMGWQMYAYGLNGELYYETDAVPDATSNPFNSGVNGDGTLFYRGTPSVIGGTTPIPLESIRLKRIRDGREDYELLRLAARQSPAAATAVSKLVKALFPSMSASDPSSVTFDQSRAQLMSMFSAAPPSAPTAPRGRTAKASAALTWGASTAGSSPVTGYTATASPGGQQCSTTGALSCTVTGLTNGTTYTFTVVALSGAGASVESAASNQVVPQAQDSIDDFNCDGTADFMAVKAGTGDLSFYPREQVSGKRDWFPDVPIQVGTGYGASSSTLKYTQMFFAGDLNGDGAPDLVGMTSTGALQLLPGNCTGSVGAPVAMGASATNPIGVGDFNGDGIPDVLDRHSDGTLWMLAGTGKGTFLAPQHIGNGWSVFDTIVAAGDMNGDGAPDVIGRKPSGALLLYEGNGAGGWNAATANGGLTLSPSLPTSEDPTLIGAGDFDGDDKTDLAAIDSTGQLSSYSGNGGGDVATTATRIGGGWEPDDLDEVVR